MSVESATYISQLDPTLPAAGDFKSEGDDHMRLTKGTLKNTWPNLTATPITATTADFNTLTNAATTGGTGFRVVTQTALDSTTLAASTSFVTSAVSAAMFTTALPAQAGKAGNFTTTNGTTASWSPTTFTFRNKIINGAMTRDERNSGVEVNPAVQGTYYLDRWVANSTVASKFKIGQNAGAVTPPVGFTNYLGTTSLSAYAIGINDAFAVGQRIEGLNIADFAWGTASAKTVTLSFWAYSSLTGTFGGSLRNSAADRSYSFTYTISAANTWEQKSVTIAGDTTGTWLTTTGIGLILSFGLGVGATFSGTAGAWAAGNYISATGAVSVVGTNLATWYLTGVQFETGSGFTNAEGLPPEVTALRCRRYYRDASPGANCFVAGYSTAGSFGVPFVYNIDPPMRAVPTVVNTPGSLSNVTNVSVQNATASNVTLTPTVTATGYEFFYVGTLTLNSEL